MKGLKKLEIWRVEPDQKDPGAETTWDIQYEGADVPDDQLGLYRDELAEHLTEVIRYLLDLDTTTIRIPPRADVPPPDSMGPEIDDQDGLSNYEDEISDDWKEAGDEF